ncbi:transposase [Dietzia cinnamea]|uniref:transposase n=1 Tax=Dietzia cinnamea TaxID=321318 RepID=UPI000AF030A3
MKASSYDAAFREQVVERLAQLEPAFPSTSAAAESVAREYGISRDSVRRWAVAAGVWQAHNSSTLRALQAENAALRAQLGQ